jgi:SAM-dependent methyltransferase
VTIRAINIGGGGKFKADGWLNLDNVGAAPFALTPECTLPVADGSLDLVYSSHTLEHLDDATVARVLAESYRVLKPDGMLLIKIPDFDLILDRYRRNDFNFFLRWPNIRTMTETCGSRGVAVSIASIAAQCFCGFWNSAFGDMFAGYNVKQLGAYYGPPVMSEGELQSVIAMTSPHDIAATLRAHVIEHERDYTFNHQNAWSRDEFSTLLLDAGFSVTSHDPDRVISEHRAVPGIDGMRDISAYYSAVLC